MESQTKSLLQTIANELRPIWRVFLNLAKSRKFWTLLMAVLASEFGLELEDGTQALIYLVAGMTFAGTTAWEDAATKHQQEPRTDEH